MHKNIAYALTLILSSQSGCGIVSQISKQQDAKAAEAEQAAVQKSVQDAVAANDIAKLKTECTTNASETAKPEWCRGYRQLFADTVDTMDCEAAWNDYKSFEDLRTSSTSAAVASAVANCGKWELYFTECLPELGDMALGPMDERLESPFLEYTKAGGAMDLELGAAVFARLEELQDNGKTTGTCGDYLGVVDTYADTVVYVRILASKECADAVPVFEKGLLSENAYVRSNSCSGLSKVGTAKHIEPLQTLAWTDAYEDSNYNMPVRESCTDAYGKLKTRLAM